MAKTATPLTSTEIKHAKAKDKLYQLGDGGGLWLRVQPSGTKAWVLNYSQPLTKKRINLSLGKYPAVTLAQARKLREQAKELLAQGIDPKQDKEEKENVEREKINHTFEAVTELWLENKKANVKAKTYQGIANALINHILPQIGKTPITELTAPQVIRVLKPIEARGNIEMVGRVCQYLNQIMEFATNHGIVFSNPLSGIKAVFKKKKVKNNPHLKPEELQQLMRFIIEADIKKQTKSMLLFQLHTMTRPVETAQARWKEIDIKNKVWTIPADKAKTKIPHKIPLTVQTLEILKKMKVFNRFSPYVFAGSKDHQQHANSQTANMALKRMGLQGKQTAHGLRGIARTTFSEQGFSFDASECCLAHKVGSSVAQSYNHSTYFTQRIKIMSWWSAHIEKAINGYIEITGNGLMEVV